MINVLMVNQCWQTKVWNFPLASTVRASSFTRS